MPKVSPIQSNLNAGEFSPLLYGKVDFEKYPSALKVCLNSVPLVQGGLTRRPGTMHAAEIKDSTKKSRLIPFEFSTTQAYQIEFGDLYARFYRNNGPVLEAAKTITGATVANPVVITSTAHGFSNGDHVEIAGVVGMTQINARRFTVANAAANTFELSGVDGTSYTAYSSGGTASRVYTIVTPWAEADLPRLRVTQSADVLYVAHPSYAPRKISRTGHTAWTVTQITFLDGPYLPTNATATTMQPSATTGSVTITASAASFVSTDVGRLVRIKHSSTWGYAEITAFTSTTQVTATVKSAFGATTASASWRLGLWGATLGYPVAVTFYEDRLGWGGAAGDPARGDLSKTGDYENMAPTATDGTVADDNAVSFVLRSNKVQSIRWMLDDEKGLLIGTVSGEWIVRPSNLNEALSPTNINAKQSTRYGSADVSILSTGKAVLFAQRSGRKLRELAYVFEADGFRAPDMTVLADHITRSGIVDAAFQQEEHAIGWLVLANGTLVGLTYERDQNVLGWHRHTLGGTNPVVESVSVIPSSDGTRDEVWLIVKRTIGGTTKRYVEYMTKFWEQGDAQADAFFLDSGLTYSGSPATTISGLIHLAGETVSILADGATHPDKVVSALGAVTLDRSASKAHIGYGYSSDGQTLRNNAGAADGTAQGKTQRKHRVTFRVHDSGGLKVGPNFDKLTPVTIRTSADPTATAVPLFSGDISHPWEGDYSTEDLIAWRWYQPLPGTMLAIMPQQHTQDR